MARHVILLTDAHEAPAYELIEALRLAGVKTLIEGLRGAGGTASVRRPAPESVDEIWDQLPLAVLYEVVPGADMVELQAAIEQATTSWPGTPLIACRRQLSSFHGQSWRSLDGSTLKRLGFRAIADKAAQLPAILHEIEGHGATGELKLPDIVSPPVNSSATLLPARIKSKACALLLIWSHRSISSVIKTAPRMLFLPVSLRWSTLSVGPYISSRMIKALMPCWNRSLF